jgi:GTP-binding protein LepA
MEPWVILKIIAPPDYINNVMNLLKNLRGNYKDTEYLGKERVQINYEAPLSEIIENFYNDLKNVTRGYASMAWSFYQNRPARIVKLDILLAGDKILSLSRLVANEKVQSEASRLVKRIKDVVPRQQFAFAIQAAVGGKIIARETKSAARKDVTAGLYGGDITRKRKQLEKQKKGKKRLAQHGKVRLDSATMMKIFR